MHFLKTLGFLMVLVGYTMAGVASIISKYHTSEFPHEDELREEYDDSITVRKPFQGASYPISVEPVDKTGSPKRPDFEYKEEDEKSNLHYHDEEIDGSYARVARAVGYGDEVKTRRPGSIGFGGAISEMYKNPGIYGKGEEEEEEEDVKK